MIKKLIIKNFQSHRETVVDFAGGVNVIAGRSDSGKSAIIRALRWVLTNEPAGDAFRSYWGGETVVRLEFIGLDGNEHVIERVRGDSRNLYIVDGVEYSGFGKTVPDIVRELLPFDELNIQRQFDAPFVLSATPSEFGEMISKMFGFDLGQQLLSTIGKQKWALNDTLKNERARLAETEKRLAELEWVESAVAVRDQLLELGSDREKLEMELVELERLVSEYTRVKNEFDSLAWAENAAKHFTALEKLIDQRRETESELNRLAGILENGAVLKRKIERVETEIAELEKRFHDELGDVCPLCGQPIQQGVEI